MDGEVIRIRNERFIIGRNEGHLKIPIDGRISARHVEIALKTVDGQQRWVLTDLQSKNGTFFRISRTVLADQGELLVGRGLYRFDAPAPDPDATADWAPNDPRFGTTKGWGSGGEVLRPPALTELIGDQIGNRTVLVQPEYWIGTDPGCSICRPDDSYCESYHVRVYRSRWGRWHAEHHKSQNGLWLRVSQVVATSVVHFQIGEQRFVLRVDR
jgi:pSer/pThr/pTyr-binding forkhead associated (FHA) protein